MSVLCMVGAAGSVGVVVLIVAAVLLINKFDSFGPW